VQSTKTGKHEKEEMNSSLAAVTALRLSPLAAEGSRIASLEAEGLRVNIIPLIFPL